MTCYVDKIYMKMNIIDVYSMVVYLSDIDSMVVYFLGMTATDGTSIYDEQDVAVAAGSRLKDGMTQTETVFGLSDLPTVTEIVRKTIAKTKRLENEQHKPARDSSAGPVNGIYTCTICAKVMCASDNKQIFY